MHILILLPAFCLHFFYPPPTDAGVFFRFKNHDFSLRSPLGSSSSRYFPRSRQNAAQLDTASNWFNPQQHYVEIIRQDDPLQPGFGLALGFEFDENNGEYPYTPARAVLELKDFGWGGVAFSPRDSLNYSGISNAVSNDLTVEIDSYARDTICGRFSGLLLSGGGPMAMVENGRFKVRLYRLP
ncbi:MAG: hypothetical protein ABIO24_08435 [Saprospiraceae bacterium]